MYNEIMGKEGDAVHRYKFYVLNEKEHYEIWDDNNLFKEIVEPVGYGLFDMVNAHESKEQTIESVINNISFFKYLTGEFYKRKLSGELKDNIVPPLPLTKSIYVFLMDIVEQYQKNEMEVSPETNTWFSGVKRENNIGHAEQLMKVFLYAKECCSMWSEGKKELPYETVTKRLSVSLEKMQDDIIEVLSPTNLEDILLFVLFKINQMTMNKKLWVIRCKRCHRIFANLKQGRNVVYCDYKDIFGKSCREIVAERVDGWMKSDYDRKIQKIFVKYYNEQQRKRKRKQVTTEQVAIWSKKARAIRDQCQKGEIIEEDFIKWLDENKENYTETAE